MRRAAASKSSPTRSGIAAAGGWLKDNRTPLAVFAITRVGLFLVAYLALCLLPMKEPVGWRAYPKNLFLDGWARWDSGWYANIADHGYSHTPENDRDQESLVFFPLYPLLMRAAADVVGNTYLAGILVSNIAFLLSLLLLYRLTLAHFGPLIARRTVVLIAVYPFSFYFSAVYTESLFLLAAVAAFYYGERQRWGLASIAAAAAGATRAVGALTVFGLLLLYLEQIKFDMRKVRANVLWIPLGLLGPLAYMGFLAYRFGDPLLFIRSQNVPGWGAEPHFMGILIGIRNVLFVERFRIFTGELDIMCIMHMAVFPIALALAGYAWRRPRIAYSIWASLNLILYLSVASNIGRYAATLFPVFIAAAILLQRGRWYTLFLYVSTQLQALFLILYALNRWVS